MLPVLVTSLSLLITPIASHAAEQPSWPAPGTIRPVVRGMDFSDFCTRTFDNTDCSGGARRLPLGALAPCFPPEVQKVR